VEEKEEMDGRPSWDEYFMKMAFLVAERSTCLRRKVGAVIVKDKRILTTGYNGAPRGLKHCSEVGCLRERLNIPSGQRHELCRGVHAEQNAIIQAAIFGISIEGGTLYTTNCPCVLCTKMILNAGIDRIVYVEDYFDDLSKELLRESKIELVNFKKAQEVI
jgi:Deoxycytidylate deaminase